MEERLGPGTERSLIDQVFVEYPVHLARLWVNGDTRIKPPDPLQHVSLRRDTQDGHLDDAIISRTQPGRLEIQKHDRAVEFYR